MRRLLYIAFATSLIVACTEQQKSNEIGEYVYLDRVLHIIHLDPKCGTNTIFVEAKDVYRKRTSQSFCSKCISLEQMKVIDDSIKIYNGLK